MSLDERTDASPDVPPHRDTQACGEDGVDLTLIRWMLSLTPTQRLDVLQQHVRAILKLRHDNPQLGLPRDRPVTKEE
jgi:hypothetical protein